MKFLLIQEAGQHSDNRLFRECLCFQRALTNLGHDSMVWGLHQPNQMINFESIVEWCDVVFLMENYDTGWVPRLYDVNKIKVFWSIDSHCCLSSHLAYVAKHGIDITLCSCLPDVKHFTALSRSVWFPNAYPSELFGVRRESERESAHGLGFCGTPGPQARVDTLNAIGRNMQLRIDYNTIGPQMVSALKGYAVSLNYNIGHDVNYRTHETCGAGACLLTKATPDSGMNRLYKAHEEYVEYQTADDAVFLARQLLADKHLRAHIETAGYNRARTMHTYNNRAEELIRLLEGREIEYNV